MGDCTAEGGGREPARDAALYGSCRWGRGHWTDLCQVVSEIVKAQFAVGDIGDVAVVGGTSVSFLASDTACLTRGDVVGRLHGSYCFIGLHDDENGHQLNR